MSHMPQALGSPQVPAAPQTAGGLLTLGEWKLAVRAGRLGRRAVRAWAGRQGPLKPVTTTPPTCFWSSLIWPARIGVGFLRSRKRFRVP